MTYSHRKAFTVVELIVAVIVAGAAAVVLFFVFGGPRRGPAWKVKNNVQVQSVVKVLTIWAGTQDDARWLPGRDADGVTDAMVTGRFHALLTDPLDGGDSLDPRLLINPKERLGETPAKTVWPGGEAYFTPEHYSYALPDIRTPGVRQTRWANDLKASTPLVCDRNTSTVRGKTASVWNDAQWEGSVGFGDGHVGFFDTSKIETWLPPASTTESLDAAATKDDLFTADGPDDAYMIHTLERQ